MRRSHILALASVVIAAGAFATAWIGHRPVRPVSVGPAPTLPAAADRSGQPTPGERSALTPADPDTASSAPADFNALLARLVALAVRGIAEVRAGDIEQAKATDAEALGVFETLVLAFSDAGERALYLLTGRADPDDGALSDLTARVERLMALRLIDYTLQSRHARRPATAAQLSTFVAALLDAVQQSARIAEEIAPMLIDKPYLDETHEDEVLRIAELSPVTTHLQPYAAKLIATLWANLEAAGTRRSGDLESLALMLKDDTNPAKRSAAMQRLLTAEDPRLVDFVLSEVEQKRDSRLARELAQGAAEGVAPSRAIEVLARMRRVDDTPLTGATLTLAIKDSPSLRRAYEDLVGEGRDSALRADLISGLGFNPSPENTALTQLAFDQDPDPSVRARALLALSTSVALGEQTIERALDDVTFLGKRGERMPDVIAAIQNLVGTGELNAVARLGRRVLARQDLAPHDRADLRRLLIGALPPELRQGL